MLTSRVTPNWLATGMTAGAAFARQVDWPTSLRLQRQPVVKVEDDWRYWFPLAGRGDDMLAAPLNG